MSIKIDVDGYLSSQWEQHCRQQEEGEVMDINDKEVTITLTMRELGTTLEGLMGYIAWLETATQDKTKNLPFLRAELANCRAVHPKLDEVWWREHDLSGEGDDL